MTGPSDPKVLALIAGLSASGGTDLHGGLSAGYKLAQASGFRPWLTGLVMVAIGVALVGLTMALGG